MLLDVDSAWIMAVLLCSVRLAAIIALAPFVQALQLPNRVKIILLLALSICLVSGMHPHSSEMPVDIPSLLASGFRELLIGALMAFGVFTAFAAFSFAGSALDIQTGLNVADVFDPITRSQSPLLASLLTMIAAALFWEFDAHHALLRGLAYSFERVPIGGAWTPPSPDRLVHQFGSVFLFGLMLAAPPMFMVFLIDACLSVVSRNLPQLNVFILGTPLKIVAGISTFAIVAPHLGDLANRIIGSAFRFMAEVL